MQRNKRKTAVPAMNVAGVGLQAEEKQDRAQRKLPKLARLAPLAVVVGGLLLASGASAEDIPSVIRDAARKIFPHKKLVFEKEGVAFSTTTKTDLEVTFDAKGKVQEVEFLIPIGLVPPAVLARANKELSKGQKFTQAEIHVETGAVVYELEFPLPGGKEFEVYIGADGTLIEAKQE